MKVNWCEKCGCVVVISELWLYVSVFKVICILEWYVLDIMYLLFCDIGVN